MALERRAEKPIRSFDEKAKRKNNKLMRLHWIEISTVVHSQHKTFFSVKALKIVRLQFLDATNLKLMLYIYYLT